MKQIKSTNSQSGFLDPEKVYFVEKFGHLLKKIDSGFGVPVQEALFQRIFMAVDDFKTDLPDVVRNLEKARLRGIGKNKKVVTKRKIELPNALTNRKPKVETDIIQKKVKSEKTESNLIEKNVIETEIEIDVDIMEPQISEVITQQVEAVQQSDSNIKSSILQPSAATIREENRQKQIQRLSQKQPMQKVSVKKEKQFTPLVTRPLARPKKDLTVWERAWHRYGGYSEEAMNGHT